MEPKVFQGDVKFEGTKLIASAAVDTNKDGQFMAKVTLEIELSEIPDEVFSAISKAKAPAQA